MSRRGLNRLSFQEREEKILKAAVSLFSEKGFKGATTKALARKAGINEALIYRHFSEKSELYTAILHRKLKEAERDFLPELQPALDLPLEAGLYYLAQRIVSRFKKNQAFFRMMLFSGLENHPMSQWFLRQRLPIPETLKNFFLEKLGAQNPGTRDPEVAAKAFFGMLFHYVIISQVFRVPDYFPQDEDGLLKEYVQIFVKGIQS